MLFYFSFYQPCRHFLKFACSKIKIKLSLKVQFFSNSRLSVNNASLTLYFSLEFRTVYTNGTDEKETFVIYSNLLQRFCTTLQKKTIYSNLDQSFMLLSFFA